MGSRVHPYTPTQIEVIAEVGLNHNGSLDLAKRHVEQAAKAGATTVKFQTYRTLERVEESHPLYEVLRKCELSIDDFSELISVCADWGVEFLSTAFGLDSLNDLVHLGQGRCKIASFSLTDKNLIDSALQSSMTLLISTGASSLDEILKTSSWLPEMDSNHSFLHCISEYPISSESGLHLQNIPFLARVTGRRIGFSDHSIGAKSALWATLAGATILEKHFTVDQSLDGPDQAMSADPEIFSNYISNIREGLSILGSRRLDPYDQELPIQAFRTKS